MAEHGTDVRVSPSVAWAGATLHQVNPCMSVHLWEAWSCGMTIQSFYSILVIEKPMDKYLVQNMALHKQKKSAFLNKCRNILEFSGSSVFWLRVCILERV